MAGQNHCGAEAGEDGGIDDDDVQIIEPPAQTPPCVNSGPAVSVFGLPQLPYTWGIDWQ